jgi:threonine aldolase
MKVPARHHNSATMLTEKDEVIRKCTRFLEGHQRLSPHLRLTELGEWADPESLPDYYGQGELITDFEQEIANLLGKEAAVFMPSGTMCQAISLRIWADRKGTHTIAFHPTCHLELHEEKAYHFVHGLKSILVGSPDKLITLEDLNNIREPLAVLLIELPQREIGGQLPSWRELCAITDLARELDIRLHLDGARLWECKPFYGREYTEIAALFDTVYVSFYKGLGAIAGALLTGPADVIAESRIWQRRLGGNLFRLYPYVIAARKAMQERLGRMYRYHEKALEIAAILSQFSQIKVIPDPPHTNMMHVHIQGDHERLEAAGLEVARRTGVELFYTLKPDPLTGYHKFELAVGDATLDLSADEIATLFRMLLKQAHGSVQGT